MATSPQESRLLPSLSGAALARFIRLVQRTSKVAADPADYERCLRENQPFIFSMWHGQFMMLPMMRPQDLPVRIMVARHGDAEYIGEALSRLGMELIRGAGAGARKRDRGGSQALRASVSALKDGYSLAMTADVPPGPARKTGMGIITLARLSGRPIIPAAIATSRYRSLNTWSRMTINLPFSKLGFVVGEPIFVPKDADAAELERLRMKVEDAMNAVTARAYDLAGADAARATPHASRKQIPTVSEGGWRLSSYRGVTRIARPLAPLILRHRTRQGKEDPARQGERLGRPALPRPHGNLAWVHAASVGELNAVLPLLDALKARRPDIGFLVTTGTLTSARLAAQRLKEGDIHQFVPLDSPQFVGSFLDHWRPDFAILTESEIWPNLIIESAARAIPLSLVNARMSGKSAAKWRRGIAMARCLFGSFELVLAQNEKLARRFQDLGARDVRHVGNLKVDSPPPPLDEAKLGELIAASQGRSMFIAASTHAGECEIVADAHAIISRRIPGFLTIIAPRHPDRAASIATVLEARGLKVARRSLGEPMSAETDIYLADTIGELGTFYTLCPIALIGGSLVPRGGQNPIEAIRLGASVLSGPYWQNFRDEYRNLAKQQAVGKVATAQDLAREVTMLLSDRDELKARRERATAALVTLSGALIRTVDALLPLLPPPPDDAARAGEKTTIQTAIKEELQRAS